MAKRHIKSYIKCLSFAYSEAQKLYEKCAESLSENLIDPEVYNNFCERKNTLDAALNSWSRALDLALDRKKFLAELKKTKARVEASDKLTDLVSEDPTATPEYKAELAKVNANLIAEYRILREVDIISSFKNRSKYHLVAHFGDIDARLLELEQFYNLNLKFEGTI